MLMSKVLRRVVVPMLLAAPLALTSITAATAGDTPGCVDHDEFDNMVQGLGPGTVENRFDTDGWYIGDNDNVFKRGYRTCWAPGERKVVIGFDLDSALSKWWDVRDA